MVNLEDDDEPSDDMYQPDGAYIPRILFMRDGKVVREANSGNDQYQYYYSSAEEVARAMAKFAASIDNSILNDEL